MSEENKTVELNDEELEKVTGGAVAQNADGYYVVNKGDKFSQNEQERSSCTCDFFALESKTTKNVNDTVFVCRRQAGGLGQAIVSDTYVTISFLNTCRFVTNVVIDPHEL